MGSKPPSPPRGQFGRLFKGKMVTIGDQYRYFLLAIFCHKYIHNFQIQFVFKLLSVFFLGRLFLHFPKEKSPQFKIR